MNTQPETVFHTVLHNTQYSTPFILISISLEPETVNLQMEYINQDIQDATFNCLVNTPTPNKNLLDNSDDTINYIKEFIQPHHYYPEHPTTQTSRFYSPTNQYHLNTNLRTEARSTTTVTDIVSAPNVHRPTTPLTKFNEEPSNFLSTHTP